VRIRALADAVGVHVARFLVMLATLYVAAWVGIDGWYRGFAVNVVVMRPSPPRTACCSATASRSS
jgi:hypothetical protein